MNTLGYRTHEFGDSVLIEAMNEGLKPCATF